jgi:hypothetical protein
MPQSRRHPSGGYDEYDWTYHHLVFLTLRAHDAQSVHPTLDGVSKKERASEYGCPPRHVREGCRRAVTGATSSLYEVETLLWRQSSAVMFNLLSDYARSIETIIPVAWSMQHGCKPDQEIIPPPVRVSLTVLEARQNRRSCHAADHRLTGSRCTNRLYGICTTAINRQDA